MTLMHEVRYEFPTWLVRSDAVAKAEAKAIEDGHKPTLFNVSYEYSEEKKSTVVEVEVGSKPRLKLKIRKK